MSKRIIICCDGTWDTPDQQEKGIPCPTNVTKMARSILPLSKDGIVQTVFYEKGVGTEGDLIERLLGGGFGFGFSENTISVYRYIVDNYSLGDELFFFGFSRGAYTARSVVGFINKCGILKKVFSDRIPEAYKLYRDKNIRSRDRAAITFRKNYSHCDGLEKEYLHNVSVKFIGVWDTVGSLGIPIKPFTFFAHRKYSFLDLQLSRIVKNAFHAVSIDERRKPYMPTLWEYKADSKQRVEQVWFAGVHANVGGGYADAGLADITFMWMKERAKQCGIAFDEEYIRNHVHPKYDGEIVNSATGIFRLLGKYVRKIGKKAPSQEAVHITAIDRLNNPTLNYQPDNLKKYLNGLKIPIINLEGNKMDF